MELRFFVFDSNMSRKICLFIVALLLGWSIVYYSDVYFPLSNGQAGVGHVQLDSSILSDDKYSNESRGLQLPGIIQAGVQKSGTTALADFLHRAGVCLSRLNPSEEKQDKEPHFFDKSKLYERGVKFYSDMFAHCENTTLAMDATPDTFRYPHRVRETYDLVSGEAAEQVKIIIVVREPVARELSRYNHNLHKCLKENGCSEHSRSEMLKYVGNETQLRTFTEYADFKYKDYNLGGLSNGERRKITSLYGDFFEEWLQYFDRRQILVLSYNELKQNEQSFLHRVISFLELEVDPALIENGANMKNTMSGASKVELPPCDTQERLSNAFSPSIKKFYRLMDSVGESPLMEEKPFPQFVLSNCTSETEQHAADETKLHDVTDGIKLGATHADMTVNFLSFDLGGSGLKVLGLLLSEDPSEGGAKFAKPYGNQVTLGYIPGNTVPKDWLQEVIQDNFSLKSVQDWPDFGFSGWSNTYKLFGRTEYEAVAELTKFGNIDIACADISNEVPGYAKNIEVWCKTWLPADHVLGFSDVKNPGFRGSFSDGRGHFEGARARLEQSYTVPNDMPGSEAPPLVFVSWGLGTGQTIFWTKDVNSTYHPAKEKTALPAPQILSTAIVAHALSSEPVDYIHEILVEIPKGLAGKHMTSALDGYERPLQGSLPFWLILDGSVWLNPSISHADVQTIYKAFFRDQVMNAIHRGDLPKPRAMVFSGGQQDHFNIAELLRDILEEQDIESVEGFHEGIHCGIARLSYPNIHINCHFHA